MDKVLNHEIKATNGCKTKPMNNGLDSRNIEDQADVDGDEDSESSLLLPPRKGGLSRKSDSIRRNVQWNDNKGNKLVEVLEYEPSEVSDSDDDDESDYCMCIIM